MAARKLKEFEMSYFLDKKNKFMKDVKEVFNTRGNEKTGRYYIKGQKGGHKEENPFSGLTDYEDDPELNK